MIPIHRGVGNVVAVTGLVAASVVMAAIPTGCSSTASDLDGDDGRARQLELPLSTVGTLSFSDGTRSSGLAALPCPSSWLFDLALESFCTPGRMDIFLGDHRTHDSAPPGINCMARNNGNGTFSSSGHFDSPGAGVWSTMAVDYDNDGKIDLSVNWDSADNSGFHNDGGGTFSSVPPRNMPFANQSNGMAWSDVDGDGRPDYATTDMTGLDRLFLQQADGRYADVTAQNPVSVGRATMAIHLADLNGDDWPDLLVQPFSSPSPNAAGIFNPAATHTTRVLFNRGAGPGRQPVFAAPKAVGLDHAPGAGVALGDYDNDGALDVLAVGSSPGGRRTLQVRLFHNDGHGQFTDVSSPAGLPADTAISEYTVIYLHSVFVDADGDGLLDLFWADPVGQHLFKNLGGGRFGDVTALAHLDGKTGTSRPVRIAVGDVDADGAVDLVVLRTTDTGTPGNGPTLFHNDGGSHGIRVRLVGASLKTALGSKVSIYDAGHVGDPAYLRGTRQVLQSTSHRQSLEQHFGVQAGKAYDVRAVFWPSRRVVDVHGVSPCAITIPER